MLTIVRVKKAKNTYLSEKSNRRGRVKTNKNKSKLKIREDKLPLVSHQCAVYSFQWGLCDAGYVCYTCRHLHQRIEEHKGSAIGNHLREQHDMEPEDIAQSLRILRTFAPIATAHL